MTRTTAISTRAIASMGLVLAAAATVVRGVELTMDNYEELTTGKIVFLKYYQPMCGHCIQMEDAWEELGIAFATSKSKLIGEIDCTSDEARQLCEAAGIDGFPTLKWGSIFDLQEYEGPREYKALKKFADKHLKPQCGPDHLQLCDKETRKEIRRLKQLSLGELDKEIYAKTEEYNTIEKASKEFVANLESQYEIAKKEKEAALKQIQDGGGLALMKAVASMRDREL